MIVVERKNTEELLGMLADRARVLIVGCGTCATECAGGGQQEAAVLASLLRMGLRLKGLEPEVRCVTLEKQCDWDLVEAIAPQLEQVDVVLSMACGIGVQALAERFCEVSVLPAVDTTTLAMRQEPGTWESRCAACGDCQLGRTFGLCPVARCSKSLSNGPCGGTRAGGKCEIDEATDCVWSLVVARAEKRGALASLAVVTEPKDWSKSRHGGPRKIVREDQK